MFSFHVKFVQTDRLADKQYAPDLSIQEHEKIYRVVKTWHC